MLKCSEFHVIKDIANYLRPENSARLIFYLCFLPGITIRLSAALGKNRVKVSLQLWVFWRANQPRVAQYLKKTINIHLIPWTVCVWWVYTINIYPKHCTVFMFCLYGKLLGFMRVIAVTSLIPHFILHLNPDTWPVFNFRHLIWTMLCNLRLMIIWTLNLQHPAMYIINQIKILGT